MRKRFNKTKHTNEFLLKATKEALKISKLKMLQILEIKGQSILNSTQDAIDCFFKYNIDYLIIDNFIFKKNEIRQKKYF